MLITTLLRKDLLTQESRDRDHLEEYSAAELSDKDLLNGFSPVEFRRQGSFEKFPLPERSDEM